MSAQKIYDLIDDLIHDLNNCSVATIQSFSNYQNEPISFIMNINKSQQENSKNIFVMSHSNSLNTDQRTQHLICGFIREYSSSIQYSWQLLATNQQYNITDIIFKYQPYSELKLMCWNIHGKHIKGATEYRKTEIPKIIVAEQPDIVFVVEPQWKDIRDHLKHTERYTYEGTKKESGFLFKPKFMELYPSWYDDIKEKLKNTTICDAQGDAIYKQCQLNKRCFIMHSKKFIFISYHGQHNYKTDRSIWKQRASELLLYIMIWLNQISGKQVIVGGDFNYDLINSRLKIPISNNGEKPIIYEYETGKRCYAKYAIDFFVSFGDDMRLRDVHSIHLFPFDEPEDHDKKLLLDHDPLVAHLIINND